jgi:hypothetical protein
MGVGRAFPESPPFMNNPRTLSSAKEHIAAGEMLKAVRCNLFVKILRSHLAYGPASRAVMVPHSAGGAAGAAWTNVMPAGQPIIASTDELRAHEGR